MPLAGPDSLFKTDARGVSEVIGFLLVFGFIIILLSINQAQVVPQENAEIEFKHSEEVQNDLIEVRSSISTAGQADVSQFPTVKLGTNYPTRTFALNPSSATGTLQTSDQYNITITNQTASLDTGTTENVSTRFLQYQPGYNELDADPIWYEHSVLYIDAREQGGVAILEDQDLVTSEGSVVRITALQNEYRKRGTGRVTIELYPTQTTNADAIPTGDIHITLPTRLTGEEYWNTAIDSAAVDADVTNASDNDYNGEGIHALNLNINTSEGPNELQLNTVGTQSEPSANAQKHNVGSGDGSGGDGGTDTGGSTAAEQVQYVDDSGSAAREGDESRVDFDIENTGDSDVQITDIEIGSSSGNLAAIREDNGGSRTPGQHEVFIDSSTAGIYEASGDISAGADPGTNAYDLGTKQALTQTGILSDSETAQVTLLDFRNNGGNIAKAADKELTIILYFQDGSSLEFSFTPPGY